MTDKIQCGGLMERTDLCLVEVLGLVPSDGQARGVLDVFGEARISLNYLSVGHGVDQKTNMSFCVQAEDMLSGRDILDRVRDDFDLTHVGTHEPVTILTLYGPHFLEKPALVAEVFAALRKPGIGVHTVCSSINSISVVVGNEDRDRTVGCLRQRFTWPE